MSTYLNTLGTAHYRLNHFAAAIPLLELSLAKGEGESDAFDLFFLAMCHKKLGHQDKAMKCYLQAVKWQRGHESALSKTWNHELEEFRAEADELLKHP